MLVWLEMPKKATTNKKQLLRPSTQNKRPRRTKHRGMNKSDGAPKSYPYGNIIMLAAPCIMGFPA